MGWVRALALTADRVDRSFPVLVDSPGELTQISQCHCLVCGAEHNGSQLCR